MKMNFLILVFFFSTLFPNIIHAENYANVTFQKSQSYELADLITLFSLPKNSYEPDWIGINSIEKVEFLYKVDELQQLKSEPYKFGGVVGLIFNGNGFKTTEQYWENGLLKQKINEVAFTTNVTFYCPVWNGYDHINIGINLPPNRISFLMNYPASSNFEENLVTYLKSHQIDITEIDKYTNKYYRTKHLYKISFSQNDPLYLVLDSWSGSGGVLGHTSLDLYFNLKRAKSNLINS